MTVSLAAVRKVFGDLDVWEKLLNKAKDPKKNAYQQGDLLKDIFSAESTNAAMSKLIRTETMGASSVEAGPVVPFRSIPVFHADVEDWLKESSLGLAKGEFQQNWFGVTLGSAAAPVEGILQESPPLVQQHGKDHVDAATPTRSDVLVAQKIGRIVLGQTVWSAVGGGPRGPLLGGPPGSAVVAGNAADHDDDAGLIDEDVSPLIHIGRTKLGAKTRYDKPGVLTSINSMADDFSQAVASYEELEFLGNSVWRSSWRDLRNELRTAGERLTSPPEREQDVRWGGNRQGLSASDRFQASVACRICGVHVTVCLERKIHDSGQKVVQCR